MTLLFFLDGPFTMFAPTDDAFQNLSNRDLTNLLDQNNNENLRKALRRHVIASKPTLFKRGIKWAEHTTLSGEQLQTQVKLVITLSCTWF